MTLQFTPDEFALLADFLEQQDRELTAEIAWTEHGGFKHALQKKQQYLATLKDKCVRRELQLEVEELEILADVLGHCERGLIAEIARTDLREFRHALQKKEESLRRVHDKVTELCAMLKTQAKS